MVLYLQTFFNFIEENIKDVDVQEICKKKKVTETKILMNKIKMVSKFAKMQKTLREESENIIKIKVF